MKKLLKKIYSLFLPHGTRSFWKYRRRILFPKGIQKIFKPYYSLRAQWTLDKLNSSIPITERIRPFQAPHGLCGSQDNRRYHHRKRCAHRGKLHSDR